MSNLSSGITEGAAALHCELAPAPTLDHLQEGVAAPDADAALLLRTKLRPKLNSGLKSGLTAAVKALLPLADLVLAPLVYPAALLLKLVRMAGVHRMPLCKKGLLQVGVFPVRDHYFEPLFNAAALERPLDQARALPGIKWNVAGQLALLEQFRFNEELAGIGDRKGELLEFHFNNVAFESGDAEFLYNLIRCKKPSRLFEIGSGYSTLMAIRAIARNREEDPRYRCRHLCIEPYEMPWLEQAPVEAIRERVEKVGGELFAELGENDLLFIDSSHVIRPQGDVLFEYLELLPALRPGVIVHVHDIFSPRDYPAQWLREEVRLWNEQYLLEAFLTHNRDWKVIGAVSYLHHNHYQQLRDKSPYLTPDAEPGSFYLQKVS